MANIEIQRPSQTYSADITIAVGAASGTLTTSANLPIFSSSQVFGYVIKSGANPGTLALTHTALVGLSRFTATTSANVAGVDLVITVYWNQPVSVAGLAGLIQV
jgi:alpha-D-ribose 1-methylphosphonate 5-triphosphate synthase subunit PhnH